MKLVDLQEAKYSEPKRREYTGTFFTGTAGEYIEPRVTLFVKCGGEKNQYAHMTSIKCVIEEVSGSDLAEELIKPNHTVVVERSEDGWVIHGYNVALPLIRDKYGDGWKLFDPNYKWASRLSEAKYAAPARSGRQIAHAIRKAILDKIPEWKPLRRLRVSVQDNYITVFLMTGLLDIETIEAFDKTGTLTDNARLIHRIVQGITGREFSDHSIFDDLRKRGEELVFGP